MDLSPRVRSVCDLNVAEMREYSGRHEYDGRPQDLSPAGVRAGLARLAATRADGERVADSYDEAQLAAAEDLQWVSFAELEQYRRNPMPHLAELDLACYDKDYAPAAERDAARAEHLAAWPRVIDAAVESLDRVSAPVAEALLGAVRGLAAGLRDGPAGDAGLAGDAGAAAAADARPGVREAALAAHARLVAHVERAAAEGDPDPALGGAALAALMSSAEALPVDLGRLAEQADAERDRLHALLAEDCARLAPGRPALEVARELVRDHPDGPGVIDAARLWTERAIEFTREHDLVPYHDGVCLVGPAPESRRWAMAMMSPAAPGEPDGPSWYPHHAARGVLAAAREGRVAGGLQHRYAAGHYRARGGSRALLPRPGAAPADL